MRHIPLKTIEMINPADGMPLPFIYSEIIKSVLSIATGDGYTIEQIRHLVSISQIVADATNAGSDKVLLEEDEFAVLSEMLVDFKWRIASAAVVEFYNDVMNAEKVNANKAA